MCEGQGHSPEWLPPRGPVLPAHLILRFSPVRVCRSRPSQPQGTSQPGNDVCLAGFNPVALPWVWRQDRHVPQGGTSDVGAPMVPSTQGNRHSSHSYFPVCWTLADQYFMCGAVSGVWGGMRHHRHPQSSRCFLRGQGSWNLAAVQALYESVSVDFQKERPGGGEDASSGRMV